MWSLYLNGKETDFTKGIMDGESACRYRKVIIEDRYDELDLCWYKYPRVFTYRIDESLRKAQDLYFEYLEKENKTNYEKGFFEGVKLFLNMNREEYYLREYAKISPTEFNNTVQQPTEEPAQELVSSNRTKPRKRNKASIAWTEEDDKLIYSAVKKYTTVFTSLPAGYTREDVLQEAAQAWAKVLKEKGGHDPTKGQKSTLLYRVVQNKIQDLIKAANTDKREVLQHTTEFNDEYVLAGRGFDEYIIGPESNENTAEQYNDGELKPAPNNLKDSARWQYEQEIDTNIDDLCE